MPRFKPGDHVAIVDARYPHLQDGVVLRVNPDDGGIEWFTEYEVDFTLETLKVLQTQLRPLSS